LIHEKGCDMASMKVKFWILTMQKSFKTFHPPAPFKLSKVTQINFDT